MDHVKIETLREWAGVESIRERHHKLLNVYYERALISNNPLINKLFKSYHTFKRRNFLNETLAVGPVRSLNLAVLEMIRRNNVEEINRVEMYPTTLCRANKTIRENYSIGPVGSNIR